MKKLVFVGKDGWDRNVYKDEDGVLWKNVNLLGWGLPSLHNVCGNEFDGEPDFPLSGDYEIVDHEEADEAENSEVATDGESDDAKTAVMGWLNVKSKLPEDNSPVLAAIYSGADFRRVTIAHYSTGLEKWFDHTSDEHPIFNHLTGKVAFWQPLPEPPVLFMRYAVVHIAEDSVFKGITVKRYDSREAYDADIDVMASTFTGRLEAVREAKRIARIAGIPYVITEELE